MTTPDLDRAIQVIRAQAGDKAGEWPEKAASAVIEALLLDPSEEVVEAAVVAVEATPNLFIRSNKAREDGYRFEICWPGDPIEIIAAYRENESAVARCGQLQRRALCRAALRATGLHYLGRTE